MDGRGYFALPLFAGLRMLARTLLSKKWTDLALKVIGHRLIPKPFSNGTSVFEFQPVHIRRELMHAMWRLLQEWPDAFLRYAAQAHLQRYAFDSEGAEVPYWFHEGIDRLPGRRCRLIGIEEATSACRYLISLGEPLSPSSLCNTLGLTTDRFLQANVIQTLKNFQ